MPSKRSIFAALALLAVFFLFYQGMARIAAQQAPSETGVALSQPLHADTSELEGLVRRLVREHSTELRRDVARDLKLELHAFAETLAASLRESQGATPSPVTLAASTPVQLTTAAAENGPMEISSLSSKYCLDANPTAPGAPVRMWVCHHGACVWRCLFASLYRRDRDVWAPSCFESVGA
jgi:hypothetical protein